MTRIIQALSLTLIFSNILFCKNPYPYAFESASNSINFYTLSADGSYKIRKHELKFNVSNQGLIEGTAIVYHTVSNLNLFSDTFPLTGKIYRSKKAADNLYYGWINLTSGDGIKYKGEIKSGFLVSSNEPPKRFSAFKLKVKSHDDRVAVLTPKFPPYSNIYQSNSFTIQLDKPGKESWLHAGFQFDDLSAFKGLISKSQKNIFSLDNAKVLQGTKSSILEESPGIIDVNLQAGNWRRVNFDAVSGNNTSIKGVVFMNSYLTNSHYEYPIWFQLIAPVQNKRQAIVLGTGF